MELGRILISIPVEVLVILDRMAKSEYMSRSAFLRKLIMDYHKNNHFANIGIGNNDGE
jgi:metal-responsive CopG/Arc/MetJ family transcriptional regulator